MKDIKDGIYPSDIKKMSVHDMELLCCDIRDTIISTVSETGGHLASNLGVVELTVAMHRVFNAPEDKIVWDVGHQSYVHKLLTGRGGKFSTLRQLDGMSGFPKRNESEYDTFDTGHSSNSISAALGMAVARDIRGEDYSVVAMIGDGALTGGMVYEAMNNAGVMDTSLIVILNDNAMSISEDHGSLSQHLGKLRSSEKYNSIKKNLKDTLRQIPGVGNAIFSGLENLRDAVKYMVVPGVLFEELGFAYLGPVDGHNLSELIEVFTYAKQMKKPVLVHCMTTKGKGYRPAEKRPDRFHGVTAFDRETGASRSQKTGRTFSDVFGSKITSLADSDERIVAISAAMVDGTGLSGFARKYPDRIFDVGIAEEHAVTFAAGLAAGGLRPVVAVYSTFLQRAYDQLMIDVCMQKLPVVFCIDRAGVVGADGETHHGVFDISYLEHMPNMTILAPSDAYQLENMMEYAFTLEGPCAIRYPRGVAEDNAGSSIGKNYENGYKTAGIEKSDTEWLPQSRILRRPERSFRKKKITLIGVGKMTGYCIEAAEILSSEGIEAEIIDAVQLKPVTAKSEDIIRQSVKRTGCAAVVEDNVVLGGFGDVIEAMFAAESDTAVYKIGWPDEFIHQGTQAQLEHRFGLDPEGIAEKVSGFIERKA